MCKGGHDTVGIGPMPSSGSGYAAFCKQVSVCMLCCVCFCLCYGFPFLHYVLAFWFRAVFSYRTGWFPTSEILRNLNLLANLLAFGNIFFLLEPLRAVRRAWYLALGPQKNRQVSAQSQLNHPLQHRFESDIPKLILT